MTIEDLIDRDWENHANPWVECNQCGKKSRWYYSIKAEAQYYCDIECLEEKMEELLKLGE